LREQLKEAGEERLNHKLSLLEGKRSEPDFEPVIVVTEKSNLLWRKIFKKREDGVCPHWNVKKFM
jgi:hypothetical protein